MVVLRIFAAKGRLRRFKHETIHFHQQCFRYSWLQSKLISLQTMLMYTTNMYKEYMQQNSCINEIHIIRDRNKQWEMCLSCIYFLSKYIKNPFHSTLTQIQIALHAIRTQILKRRFHCNPHVAKKYGRQLLDTSLKCYVMWQSPFKFTRIKAKAQEKALLYLISLIEHLTRNISVIRTDSHKNSSLITQ